MTYVSRQSGTSRLTSIVAVGAIHVAIGAALIYGFAPDLVKIIKPGPLIGINLPPPPPPAPPPPKQQDSQTPDSVITAPTPPIDLVPPLPAPPKIDVPTYDPVFPIDIAPPAEPTGKPSPAFDARSPVPANDVSRWATDQDYPGIALKREEQGVSRFRAVVGSNGKVKSCEITASSGSSTLDEATCKLVTRRARFEPAINDRGEKVVGTYSSAIRWQLPD